MEQAEKEQAQVIGILCVAFGVAPGRMEPGGPGRGEQALTKAGQQIPLVEIFLGQVLRVVGHAMSSPEAELLVQ